MTIEDVRYVVSGYYQGTPYNPYSSHDTGMRGMYRSIGINRTGVTSICQIRSDVPDEIKGLEWICFGSTAFGAFLPVYTNVEKMPKYLSNVTFDTSTENFYWGSRLISALTDPNYPTAVPHVERYQNGVFTKGRQIVLEYDRKMTESGDFSLTAEANEKLSEMAKEKTIFTLNQVLNEASLHMKNGYNRGDN